MYPVSLEPDYGFFDLRYAAALSGDRFPLDTYVSTSRFRYATCKDLEAIS